jgi:hypothetical protein
MKENMQASGMNESDRLRLGIEMSQFLVLRLVLDAHCVN